MRIGNWLWTGGGGEVGCVARVGAGEIYEGGCYVLRPDAGRTSPRTGLCVARGPADETTQLNDLVSGHSFHGLG